MKQGGLKTSWSWMMIQSTTSCEARLSACEEDRFLLLKWAHPSTSTFTTAAILRNRRLKRKRSTWNELLGQTSTSESQSQTSREIPNANKKHLGKKSASITTRSVRLARNFVKKEQEVIPTPKTSILAAFLFSRICRNLKKSLSVTNKRSVVTRFWMCYTLTVHIVFCRRRCMLTALNSQRRQSATSKTIQRLTTECS